MGQMLIRDSSGPADKGFTAWKFRLIRTQFDELSILPSILFFTKPQYYWIYDTRQICSTLDETRFSSITHSIWFNAQYTRNGIMKIVVICWASESNRWISSAVKDTYQSICICYSLPSLYWIIPGSIYHIIVIMLLFSFILCLCASLNMT